MKKKGFTLIEIMIILLVFSVGVLAVLQLTLYNINAMKELEAKTSATLLAKEGLEIVYNTRDSNRIASLPRDCIINETYDANLSDKVCKNNFLDNKGIRSLYTKDNSIVRKPIENDPTEESKLFIDGNGYIKYTHETTEQSSIFSRYIYFTGVKDGDKIINTGYILKIESHVAYQRGSRTGEVILEGFIGNY